MKAFEWADSFYIRNSAFTSSNRHTELTVAGKINLWLSNELAFIKIVVNV